jgi:hypothetical protein
MIEFDLQLKIASAGGHAAGEVRSFKLCFKNLKSSASNDRVFEQSQKQTQESGTLFCKATRSR